VPKEIAEKLEHFRSPAGDLPGFWAMRDFMSWWKKMTLDFAGLPFQVQNFFGDSINLYKTDPAAFEKYWEALQIMLKQAYKPEWLSETQKKVLKLANSTYASSRSTSRNIQTRWLSWITLSSQSYLTVIPFFSDLHPCHWAAISCLPLVGSSSLQMS